MTEKDLQKPTDAELMPDQSEEEQVLVQNEEKPEQDSPEVVQGSDFSSLNEEQEKESQVSSEDKSEESPETKGTEEDENESPSEFLLQWQKRHEAYLADHKGENEETSNATSSDDSGSFFKKGKKKKRPKLDQRPFEGEKEAPEDQLTPKKDPIPQAIIWKSLPIISLALSLAIICLYFITPLGTAKTIVVQGNEHVSTAEIVKDSLINQKDYVVSTILNRVGHENNIKQASPWIKKATIVYNFPNKFVISIQEYNEIGYVKEGDAYYSVLSSGAISETATPQDQLPASYTTIHLTDRDLIKKLVLQLATVNRSILADIQDINLTPSKVTNDLLTLTMVNGHKVLVPLSDIDRKLPYYEKIAPQLQLPSVIDMEVGIFSYPSP